MSDIKKDIERYKKDQEQHINKALGISNLNQKQSYSVQRVKNLVKHTGEINKHSTEQINPELFLTLSHAARVLENPKNKALLSEHTKMRLEEVKKGLGSVIQLDGENLLDSQNPNKQASISKKLKAVSEAVRSGKQFSSEFTPITSQESLRKIMIEAVTELAREKAKKSLGL